MRNKHILHLNFDITIQNVHTFCEMSPHIVFILVVYQTLSLSLNAILFLLKTRNLHLSNFVFTYL